MKKKEMIRRVISSRFLREAGEIAVMMVRTVTMVITTTMTAIMGVTMATTTATPSTLMMLLIQTFSMGTLAT